MYMLWLYVLNFNFGGLFAAAPASVAILFGSKDFAFVYGLLFSAQIVTGIGGGFVVEAVNGGMDWTGQSLV